MPTYKKKRVSFRRKATTGRSSKAKVQNYLQVNTTYNPTRFMGAMGRAQNLPFKCMKVMKYVETFTSGSSDLAGALRSPQTMYLNNVFDPNLTGVGHQPMLFDTWATLWRRYKVLRCDVKVTAFAPSTSSVYLAIRGRASADTGTAMTGWQFDHLAEDQGAAYLIPGIYGTGTQVFYKSFNIAQFEGRRGVNALDDADYSALVTASPAAQPSISFAVGDRGGFANSTLMYTVEIAYHTLFSIPITQPQS